jgi:Leucine-rich repeat (LRR) protein
MKDRWQTIGDMHESYNLNYYNYITELTITGNFDFSLPNNLIYLDCSHSELLSLPELPNTLTHLYCGYNQLSSLPILPNSLKYLDCSNNKLSNLSSFILEFTHLPDTLTYFDCRYNQLSDLPELPNTLTYLDCSYNQLSSLPELPNTLEYLYCYNNQLSSLPEFPNTLNYLSCWDNQLSSLPELPNTLSYFEHVICSDNPFNLWSVLIDPAKINAENTEIIHEKLHELDCKIKEIEDELNENIISQYNKKMSELKKEIDKILNFEFEIIL